MCYNNNSTAGIDFLGKDGYVVDDELNTAEPLDSSDVISAVILFEMLDVEEQEEILALMRSILDK